MHTCASQQPPPGPFSSPRAWPAHLSVAGEGTPPSSAGLCLVSTELWLEDSASQTLPVHPEDPDCIASHSENSGTLLCCILLGGSQQAHSVVLSASSYRTVPCAPARGSPWPRSLRPPPCPGLPLLPPVQMARQAHKSAFLLTALVECPTGPRLL